MQSDDRIDLKWKFLFERFKILFKVREICFIKKKHCTKISYCIAHYTSWHYLFLCLSWLWLFFLRLNKPINIVVYQHLLTGLVANVFPVDTLLDEVVKKASKIAGQSKLISQICKESINKGFQLSKL